MSKKIAVKDGAKDVKTVKKQPREKKPNKIIKVTKETVSELKKVTWPSLSTVCKKTGVVLVVVLVFGAVLFGIDRLLSFLFGLLV